MGQEVLSGTNLFSIVSDGSPELEISLSYNEKSKVNQGDSVFIETENGERIEGSIYAISDVADANLNYISTITFEQRQDIIGSLVNVEIPTATNTMMLPVNAITTQGEDI